MYPSAYQILICKKCKDRAKWKKYKNHNVKVKVRLNQITN